MQKNSNMNQPQQLIVANILEDLLEKLPIEYDDSDDIIESITPANFYKHIFMYRNKITNLDFSFR